MRETLDPTFGPSALFTYKPTLQDDNGDDDKTGNSTTGTAIFAAGLLSAAAACSGCCCWLCCCRRSKPDIVLDGRDANDFAGHMPTSSSRNATDASKEHDDLESDAIHGNDHDNHTALTCVADDLL